MQWYNIFSKVLPDDGNAVQCASRTFTLGISGIVSTKTNPKLIVFDSNYYHRISKKHSHEEDNWLKFLSFDLTNRFLRSTKLSSHSKSSLIRCILKSKMQERNETQRNDLIQFVTNVLKGLRIPIIYIKHFLSDC